MLQGGMANILLIPLLQQMSQQNMLDIEKDL
jgi:cell division inhibitor SulA